MRASDNEMKTGSANGNGHISSLPYTALSAAPPKIKGPLGLYPKGPFDCGRLDNQLPLTIVHHSPKIPKIFLA